MPKLFRLLWRSSCPSPSSEFSRGQKYLSPEVATTVESSKIFWQPIQLSGISLPFWPQMSLFGEQKHFNVIECWQFKENVYFIFFLHLKKISRKTRENLDEYFFPQHFRSIFYQVEVDERLENVKNSDKNLSDLEAGERR